MSKEAMKLALEALENSVDLVREDAYQAEKLYGNYPTRQGKVNGLKVLADDHEKAIIALQKALANEALDKKAENARELGLDYEPVPENFMDALKFDVAMRDAAPVQEPVAWVEYETGNQTKRPQNCGTGYCSCIECVMEPAVPDAFGTREGEHPQYVQGWNDCRAEMLKGRHEPV
jgi:hypothetical protein